jgi:hypothetical protein
MTARARLTAIIIGFALVLSACGADDPDAVLDVDAAIDGVPIADSGPGDPQRLDPAVESVLSMTITNVSDADVEVGHVRLEGEMLGLTFLTYDTRVPLGLAPGETRELAVPLDFFDLESQAGGYLRSWVRLYADDADRTRLSSDEFVLDVRGDTLSTMSIFAILLALVTGLSMAHNLWALRRGTLPPNRFIRGMRLAVTGLGLGLLLSVAFSVLRIFPLPTSGWIPLTLLPAAIGFAVGYLLPGFVDDDVEDDDDDAENFVDRERLSG